MVEPLRYKRIFKRLPRVATIILICIAAAVWLSAGYSRDIAHADNDLPEPIEVEIGLRVEDIVEVDKQRETFEVVGSLQMRWTDPKLAYTIESCQCEEKVFSKDDFELFLTEYGDRWPSFTFHNQYGERWIQNRVVVVYPDGSAIYFERFTTNYLASFDFQLFPFDNQQFTIQIDSFYPQEIYSFKDLEGFSRLGDEYGEEEMELTGFSTQVTSVVNRIGYDSSRFIVQFKGPRHLEYYIFRIFLPLLGILLISWFAFFLKDFHKRLDVELANVVLYITFSFSLSDNYPRLGYPTFLDAIMIITLLSNILGVLLCVTLKLLENKGNYQRLERIDRILIWLYPVFLISIFLIAVGIFFH
jgi:hypothetical protein